MRIILKERIEHLGRSGDIVNVKEGYARNFLLPKGYAVKADDKNVKFLEHNKRVIQRKVDKEKKDVERVAELINAKTYTIQSKLASENKLYGSVGSNDVFELLKADGFNVYKKDLIFDSVKQPGTYKVKVDLGHGINAELSLIVEGDGEGFVEAEEDAFVAEQVEETMYADSEEEEGLEELNEKELVEEELVEEKNETKEEVK